MHFNADAKRCVGVPERNERPPLQTPASPAFLSLPQIHITVDVIALVQRVVSQHLGAQRAFCSRYSLCIHCHIYLFIQHRNGGGSTGAQSFSAGVIRINGNAHRYALR